MSFLSCLCLFYEFSRKLSLLIFTEKAIFVSKSFPMGDRPDCTSSTKKKRLASTQPWSAGVFSLLLASRVLLLKILDSLHRLVHLDVVFESVVDFMASFLNRMLGVLLLCQKWPGIRGSIHFSKGVLLLRGLIVFGPVLRLAQQSLLEHWRFLLDFFNLSFLDIYLMRILGGFHNEVEIKLKSWMNE